MALNMPNNPGACDDMAQKFGALVPTDFGCAPVSGKVIRIEDTGYSVQEGAEICNFNMHCAGVKPAVQKREQLPGPVENDKKGQIA